MGYVEQLLARNERIVRVAHDHWIVLLPTILVDAALSIVVIGLSVGGVLISPPLPWFGLLFLLVPIGHLGLRMWAWWNKQYVVTDRRIIEVAGTVNKRVSDTSLEKVNDIVMEQTMMGRLLKFGDIRIIAGSDSGIDVFHHIADPIGFKKELLEQKADLGSLDRFEGRTERGEAQGDIPELIAELDELREKGILTQAEFEEKKQRLLDRI